MDKYNVPTIFNQISDSAKENIIKAYVPGSKSITNRALLLATLANGPSTLNGVLFSDDSRHFLDCVTALGVSMSVDETGHSVTISGCGGSLPFTADLYVGSAGTAARFLTATLGVSNGIYTLDSSEQMKRRPMAPLLDSLKGIGCEVIYKEKEGHFPFELRSHGFLSDKITVNIDSSSQFLSALMIASVLSTQDLTINVEGTHGMSYIEMTRLMMKQFGADCKPSKKDETTYHISASEHYTGKVYNIEPDASAAAYFYACCPILGVSVCVPGIYKDSLQGDVQFIDALVKMGCRSEETSEGIVLHPPIDGQIHGIEINMSSFSDQAITLAVVATCAVSPTTITGIGHIRLQESDRLSAIATEMTKMGIKVQEMKDQITIIPGKANPAEIDTYNDHRIAMGFSLMGLRNPGITINDPGCCAKTFENYFEVFDDFIKKCTS